MRPQRPHEMKRFRAGSASQSLRGVVGPAEPSSRLRQGCVLLAVGALLANFAGCGGAAKSSDPASTNTQSAPPPGPPKIQHVIIIVQENRSTDNMFHGLPNADTADSGVNSQGDVIPLTALPLANDYDLEHSHAAFVALYDGGKMDGADKVLTVCFANFGSCPGPNPQFRYVTQSDVQPYFDMAEQYTFADRMFQTNQGPSFEAHQFLLAGTSAPTATSDLFAENNPMGPGFGIDVGCAAPAGQYVHLIDPTGNDSATMFPCFEHPVLTDRLDAKEISWKYYTPIIGSIWTAPNAIEHMRNGPDWANVIESQTQALTDITTGNLPQISWIMPTGQSSDHAGANDGSGPSWVASIVNAIGTSSYWSSTAIFITWDDWGGWYDHVAPPIYDSYEYGARVPLIIVSPYAKPGYVSHTTHDFGSILRFIEDNFGLDPLGYADSRADDLSDCFDYTQTPITFKFIRAPLDARFFLHDTRPPEPPDDE